jgi:transglycosylase-like protein with SLT domain
MRRRRRSWLSLWTLAPLLIGVLIAAIIVTDLAATITTLTSAASGCGSATGPAVDVADIPASLMPIYEQAAARYQLGAGGWAYLASVNYQETNFGHDLTTSSMGAVGWMQFEPGTWAKYGVSADPGTPGAPPDPYDPWDAIYSAANYLHASGAPTDWMGSLTIYGNAGWYAAQVQQRAQNYLQAATGSTTVDISQAVGCAPVPAGPTTPGQTATILPDGTAAIPQDAPGAVQAALAAGNRIIDTGYSQERNPNMLTTVMGSYDCSGSTDFVLYNAGLTSPQVDIGDHIAGDSTLLESYGEPGPGQWITVYASPAHAFIQIAGVVLDTAWWGPVQPTTPASGPRWQPATILGPQLADGNPWTQRHPAGL